MIMIATAGSIPKYTRKTWIIDLTPWEMDTGRDKSASAPTFAEKKSNETIKNIPTTAGRIADCPNRIADITTAGSKSKKQDTLPDKIVHQNFS